MTDGASIENGVTTALSALDIEASALSVAKARVSGQMAAALELLHRAAGRVIVSGIGKSGHIGAKIAASLASTGTPAFFIHSTEALHGDSGMVTGDDAAILISNSGETAEVLAFGQMLAAWGVPIIALTGGEGSTLAKLAKVTLDVSVAAEADPLGLAPTASTTCTLAVGDALAAGLMAINGFTPGDFHQRHPGGSLGKLLDDGRAA
ncbi:MAG: SIS domain-containing protein [Propionibacteriaceae bacterium]|jgi:arabinose-5-phosphate isomerase|nr:SIS domain-containing protein [Propionibacteriaceae bacterium]